MTRRGSSSPKGTKRQRKKPAAKRLSGASSDEQRFRDLFSRKNLRKTWGTVRREARHHRVRDAVDWIDWAVTVDATLSQLRESVISGKYVPSPPSRYELAKSHGSYRTITVPHIRDAVVYRVISDAALEFAIPSKVPGAFFSRRRAATPVGKTFGLKDDPYLRFFDIWLRCNEYRTRTLLAGPYQVLLVTDITNFFDSISHALLVEYLAPLGLPRKALGLLGRLLESLKPSAGHSPNPGIGIPVDEYDCSRQLAHVFLFEHDRRVVEMVGEGNYVRWMDDHHIGARSETEARRIVNLLTRSLSSQRLTLNAGKTAFLDPEKVVRCFQLEANEDINKWDKQYGAGLPSKTTHARKALRSLWRKVCRAPAAGEGHWDKILKRLYAAAAKARSSLLDARMHEHLVRYPHLDERIFLCLARRGKTRKLLDLFEEYSQSGESLFEATEAAFFEACLLLDASPTLERRIRRLATAFAKGTAKGQSGGPYGKASAVLCLYWFGLSAKGLGNLFSEEEATSLPSSVARAWLACVTVKDPHLSSAIEAKLIGHPGPDVAKLSRFLTDVRDGAVEQVGNYKNQRPRWPTPGEFYDARAWLQLDLISWAGSSKLRGTAKSDAKAFAKLARTRQEKRRLKKINARLA